MIYLDTGCFVKLYYPVPDSAKVSLLLEELYIFGSGLAF